MTYSSSAKKARRNAAREHARRMREEAEKKARRRRLILQGSIGAAIVVVVVVAVLVIVQVAKPPQTTGPLNMLSDGIVLTSTTGYVSTSAIPNGGTPTPTKQADDGTAHITLYEDLQCPICQGFEQSNDAQLARWLNAGTATVEIHPVSILDRLSNGNRYSSRAANAMACVAQYDPKDFWAVNKAFYADQPEEGSSGRTNDQLLATMKSAGASGGRLTTCVDDETFKGWVTAATNRITPVGTTFPNSKVTVPSTGFGTPTIIVNGKAYTPPNNALGYKDAAAFAKFVKGLAPKVD